MKKIFLLLTIASLGCALVACNSSSDQGGYGQGYSAQQNAMQGLPVPTQQKIIADMQANPQIYRQGPNEAYDAYVYRIWGYHNRWMTPAELQNIEYRNQVSTAALQQATTMGFVEARAQNMMWNEAYETERAQANIWDARADAQHSKRRINRDKVGTYSDTTHGISDTVGGLSDTFGNTRSMIDNFTSIFK